MQNLTAREKQLRKLKNKKAWVKFYFVAFSALIWFVIKLSTNGYVETLDYTVNVTSSSPEYIISNAQVPIKIEVVSNGFGLLKHYLKLDNEMDIQVEIDKADGNQMYLDLNDQTSLFEKNLGNQLEITDVVPNGVRLNIDVLERKMVSITPELNVKINAPYHLYGDVVLKPNKIEVWAPKEVLEGITSLPTEVINIDKEIEEQSFNVEIKAPNIPYLSVSPNEVNASFKVVPYTEKSIKVPIHLINMPLNAEVKLFPSVITVKFNVAVKDFDIIDETQFVCLADLNQIENGVSRLGLELSQIPTHIEIIEWGDKSVEFLMIK